MVSPGNSPLPDPALRSHRRRREHEFIKQHRKVEEQEATISQLKSTVAQQQKDFRATLAEQQNQIKALTTGLQKVSDQLEASKICAAIGREQLVTLRS